MTTQTEASPTATWPYRYEVIETGRLIVDHSYQRPLTSFVKRIADAWDPALVGTLVVSERGDGTFAVVDGQTRMSAASERDVMELPCIVYMGMSVADEASLFARLQKERRGIASYFRFRASLVAGEDEAVQIDRIARECGYEVGATAVKEGNIISAVAGLEKVYRRDPTLLERVLLIIKEAWGESHTPSGDILRGLGHFLATTENVDDEKLAEKMKGVSPDELKRRASALREGAGRGGGTDKYVSGAIDGVYRRRG